MQSFSQVDVRLRYKGPQMAVCDFSFGQDHPTTLAITYNNAPFLRTTRLGESKTMPVRNCFLHDVGVSKFIHRRSADRVKGPGLRYLSLAAP